MKTIPQSNNVKDIADTLVAVGAGHQTKSFIDANVATLALTENDSGKVILLNRAAGVAVTLPASAQGLTFKFVIVASVTSNAYSVTGKATTDLFIGQILQFKTDGTAAWAVRAPDGSDDDAMSMNGTTTGGVIGDTFTVTSTASGRWFIEGILKATGTVATPFS